MSSHDSEKMGAARMSYIVRVLFHIIVQLSPLLGPSSLIFCKVHRKIMTQKNRTIDFVPQYLLREVAQTRSQYYFISAVKFAFYFIVARTRTPKKKETSLHNSAKIFTQK